MGKSEKTIPSEYFAILRQRDTGRCAGLNVDNPIREKAFNYPRLMVSVIAGYYASTKSMSCSPLIDYTTFCKK